MLFLLTIVSHPLFFSIFLKKVKPLFIFFNIFQIMLDGVDDTSPANKINSVTFFSQLLLFVSIFLSVSHMKCFCFMYLFTNILFFPT